MRFLKTKIRLSQEASQKKIEKDIKAPSRQDSSSNASSPSTKSEIRSRQAYKNSSKTTLFDDQQKKLAKTEAFSSASNPKKNIIINYGNAIAAFALSRLAVPYLQPYVDNGQIKLKDFTDFVTQAKAKITGLEGFKSLLVIHDDESEDVVTYKNIFKALCEVFIKYFSVNWIIHGRVSNKLVYLKCRFNMMRRIQNPDQFTYLN